MDITIEVNMDLSQMISAARSNFGKPFFFKLLPLLPGTYGNNGTPRFLIMLLPLLDLGPFLSKGTFSFFLIE
jgi:hypothetical protein